MTTASASTDRDTPTRKPGRPRSARAHQAILAAALALLAEEGFEAMSMEGVAARAGVGKSTIYRRWASKEELLIEAVSSIHAEAPIVDTGNIRDDLLALARAGLQGGPRSALQRLFPRLLSEAATNSPLIDVFLERVMVPRFQLLTDLVERAKSRGELRADLDPTLVIDLFVGAFTLRLLVTGRLSPPGPNFAEEVVDVVLRGIAAPAHEDRAKPTRSGRRAGSGERRGDGGRAQRRAAAREATG
jgi:AcrR family transcriptional regulator